MWELGNLWSEGKSTSMASSYLTVMHEIHVLLVDHDSEGLMNTAKLLEVCQYRVTLVELASAAITMLSSGKVKFDIVMANINSPDLHGFKLLQLAVNMDIPIILMSVDDNTFMAMRAIESGAFLYIKKPATKEMLRCIWQHVLREKTRTIRERDRMVAANYNVRGIEFREVIHHADNNPNNIGADNMLNPNNIGANNMLNPNINIGANNMLMMNDKGKSKKNNRGRKGAIGEEDYDSENNMMISNKIKRKVCTEWTQELHEKFMDAVEQLGEGRCFPKEILELMNVPGLTRMQVASHLQKCRNDNWRSPEERKSNQTIQPLSSDTDGSGQHKPRKFGSMPRLGKAPSYHVQDHQESSGVGQGSKSHSETEMPNDGGIENMGTGPIMVNQHYGTLVPHPSIAAPGIYSSNPRHPSDDFFSFPDMDCLIQNFSGLPQASAGMNIPNSSSGGYHFEPVYHEQNSKGMPSMDNRSQWSSETSNFGSDESETRGH
ncbi:hypothetical protein Pfo_012286 [Paulownia fortunei]|nr:hypothetical protein Pfo_012286 [Paulownia fortunei]